MYSQNNERRVIAEYFGDKKGVLLDIGANDGVFFSNSFDLIINKGWQACLVEPSQKAFSRLYNLYKDNDSANLFMYAIGNKTGMVDFWESGGIYEDFMDTSLLSTIDEKSLHRWTEKPEIQFTKTRTHVKTFSDFLLQSPVKMFDMISIDAEGMDVDILKQMNLNELQTSLLIIEWVEDNKEIILRHMKESYPNLPLYVENTENLIFAKTKRN